MWKIVFIRNCMWSSKSNSSLCEIKFLYPSTQLHKPYSNQTIVCRILYPWFHRSSLFTVCLITIEDSFNADCRDSILSTSNMLISTPPLISKSIWLKNSSFSTNALTLSQCNIFFSKSVSRSLIWFYRSLASVKPLHELSYNFRVVSLHRIQTTWWKQSTRKIIESIKNRGSSNIPSVCFRCS